MPEDIKGENSPAGRPQVTKDEVLLEGGAANPKASTQLLTATQKAGMSLAWFFGSAILVITAFVWFSWYTSVPRPIPPVGSPQAVVDNYKALRMGALDDASKLFDLFVAKALLPVFTAILGYVFGSRESSKHELSG